VHGGEQQAGDERKVVDEEAELPLVARPMAWAVKGEGEGEDIDGRQKRRLRDRGGGGS